MSIPRGVPTSGLVVRYDYLWEEEARSGKAEGRKDRPCVVVLPLQIDTRGRQLVLVTAITHAEPTNLSAAIELPSNVKRMLGLDGEKSWIVTSEVNVVDWSDSGFVPVKPGQWSYGSLPKALAIQLRDSISGRAKSKSLGQINR